MNTADWAIVISLCALAISAGSFIWNVWSTFIFPKAKVKVHVGFSYCDVPGNVIVTAHDDGSLPQVSSLESLTHPSVSFFATNHGPGDVNLQLAIGTDSVFKVRKRNEIVSFHPYNEYPSDLSTVGVFSGGLPKKLKVGETITVYFPVVKDWVLFESLKRFGFSDSFGRQHFCSAKDARSLNRLILNPPLEASDG